MVIIRKFTSAAWASGNYPLGGGYAGLVRIKTKPNIAVKRLGFEVLLGHSRTGAATTLDTPACQLAITSILPSATTTKPSLRMASLARCRPNTGGFYHKLRFGEC